MGPALGAQQAPPTCAVTGRVLSGVTPLPGVSVTVRAGERLVAATSTAELAGAGSGYSVGLLADFDNDGLCDNWEGGTSQYRDEPIDSDGDGIYDFRDLDSDDDGTTDAVEGGASGSCGEPLDTDNDGKFDSADTDSDGDGLSDVIERTDTATDPLNLSLIHI